MSLSRMNFPLPRELILEIASYLSDDDLLCFRNSCPHINAVIQDNRVDWRYRFARFFDEKYFHPRDGYDWKDAYNDRREKTVPLEYATRGVTRAWCMKPAIIKEILDECDFSGPYYESCNWITLRYLLSQDNSLDDVYDDRLRPSPEGLQRYAEFQLMMIDLTFSDLGHKGVRFPDHAAYVAYGNPKIAPLFRNSNGGTSRVNLTKILDIVNFFKHLIHLAHSIGDCDLARIYEDLPPMLRIQPPHEQLYKGNKPQLLGTQWYGLHGVCDGPTVVELRRNEDQAYQYAEEMHLEQYRQEMFELTLTTDPEYQPIQEFPDHVLLCLDPYNTGLDPPANGANLEEGKDYLRFAGSMRGVVSKVSYELAGIITLTRPEIGTRHANPRPGINVPPRPEYVSPWTYQRVAFLVYGSPLSVRHSTNQNLFRLLVKDGKIDIAYHPDDDIPELRRYKSRGQWPSYDEFRQWGVHAWTYDDPHEIMPQNLVARERYNERVSRIKNAHYAMEKWMSRPYRRPDFNVDLTWVDDDEYLSQEVAAKDQRYFEIVEQIKTELGHDINTRFKFPAELAASLDVENTSSKSSVSEAISDEVEEYNPYATAGEQWIYEGVLGPAGNCIVGRCCRVWGDEDPQDLFQFVQGDETHWRIKTEPFILWCADLPLLLRRQS